jgi:transcriptional regulator with XRE-family HTH domain
MSIGERIRAVRQQRHLTMQQLADAAGISQSHVSLIERSHTQPSVEKLVRLARALDVTLADLVDAEGRGAGPGQASDSAAESTEDLAPGLAELRADPTFGSELTDDWLRLLSSLSLRGRRPTKKRDWLALYLLMRPYFDDAK